MEKPIRPIAQNPAARGNYFIDSSFEAGLVLTGTEVKSLRDQSPSLREAYVELRPYKKSFEAYLINLHIAEYSHGNLQNHEPRRVRRLLLKSSELSKLFGATVQKGYTLVPLKLYFKGAWVKMEIGLGKGKKNIDKREDLKEKAERRDLQRYVGQQKRIGKR